MPLPHGNGEQRMNAQPVVDAGGGIMVSDGELTAVWVAENVVPMLGDPARIASMSAAAARYGRRDADEALARLVIEAAARRRG